MSANSKSRGRGTRASLVGGVCGGGAYGLGELLLVEGDGVGVFGIGGFEDGGLFGEGESLGGIFGGDQYGEVVGRGGVGFVELESFAELSDGVVGLTLFGEKQT